MPKALTRQEANLVIDRDHRSRRTESDTYRGDFGSSHYVRPITMSVLQHYMKDTRKKLSLDDIQTLIEDYVCRFTEKYDIHSFPVKTLGYAYYTFGPNMSTTQKDRKGYTIVQPNNFTSKSFKNYTEMVKFLNNTTNEDWYNAHIYGNSCTYREHKDGIVGFKEFRVFKKKPEKTLSKYKMNSEQALIIFAGKCPY